MSSGPRGSGRGPRGGASGSVGARGARGGSSSHYTNVASSIRGPPQSSSSAASASASTSTLSQTASTGPQRPGRPANQAGSGISTGGAGGYSGPNTGVIGITDKSGRIDPLTDPSDRCPNCKTDRFLNPRLKLLVSPCYHKLCTSCIDRIWSLGPAPCPECGNVCRKSQFGSQTFADLAVEREVDIRKRVTRIFGTKSQEDFASLREYNDFLEQAELLTSNLIYKADLEETNAKLAKLEAEAAATRGRGKDDGATNTAISGEALALSDSRMLALRQERIARRKAQDLEDVNLRREEEDEIVTALEDGLEEDDIAAIQRKYKTRREELDRNREAQEAADIRREEELRIEAAQAALGGAGGKKQGSKGVSGTAIPAAVEWQPESLLLFDGPLAPFSAGEELLPSTANPPALRPPPSVLSSEATTNSSTTWTPHDPWLQPWFAAQEAPSQQEERSKFRAGGYDVADYWHRQMVTAVASLAAVPPQ